jgi:hypothetical protein
MGRQEAESTEGIKTRRYFPVNASSAGAVEKQLLKMIQEIIVATLGAAPEQTS